MSYKDTEKMNTEAKAAISVLVFYGLCHESLGNAEENDRPNISDFPEMRIDNGKAEIGNVSSMVNIGYTLSRAKNSYFKFLGQEGMTYLKKYI